MGSIPSNLRCAQHRAFDDQLPRQLHADLLITQLGDCFLGVMVKMVADDVQPDQLQIIGKILHLLKAHAPKLQAAHPMHRPLCYGQYPVALP